MPAPQTKKRIEYVRRTWGEEVTERMIGVLTGDDHLTQTDKPAFRADRAGWQLERIQREIRGRRYIPWLGLQVHRLVRDVAEAERRLKPELKSEHSMSERGRLLSRAWLNTKQKRDDDLYILATGGWDMIADWAVATSPNLTAMDFAQAHDAAVAWHMESGRQAELDEQARSGEPIWTDPDGWTVQRLTTRAQLQFEGEQMHHCVGSYFDDVAGGTSQILSLRDPEGGPHGTFEVTYVSDDPDPDDPMDWYIEQFRGKTNEPIKPEYRRRARAFLQSRGLTGKTSGAASYVFPIWDRFEPIEDLLDGALGLIEEFYEGGERIESVPWSHTVEGGSTIHGQVFPLDLREDEELVDQVEEAMNAAVGRGRSVASIEGLSHDDLDELREKVAYAVGNAIRWRDNHLDDLGKLQRSRHVFDGQRKRIVAAKARGTVEDEARAVQSVKTIHDVLYALNDLVYAADDYGYDVHLDPVIWKTKDVLGDDVVDTDQVDLNDLVSYLSELLGDARR